MKKFGKLFANMSRLSEKRGFSVESVGLTGTEE